MTFAPHHALVTADEAAPRAWALVLHGIFGSGGNWRTFARRVVERRPGWGMVLVDLRVHGRSRAAPPPHTLAAAAADLRALAAALAAEHRPVRAVCGHSFGGKVALAYRAEAGPALAQTWVLDASPSARPDAIDDPRNTVTGVLAMLGELPRVWAERDRFTAAVVERGHPEMLGRWLAMNLERRGDELVLDMDLAGLRDLLADYYRRDLWPAVEAADAPGELRVVVAGRSTAVSDDDRARLDALAARPRSRVCVHHFADAGHWLHLEAFEALVDLVAARLPEL